LTKPAIKLLITDGGYRAIGHVAAQWAILETELDHLLALLLEDSTVKSLGLKNAQSFGHRMSNLKSASDVLLKNQEQPLKEIKDIITDASSLRGFRDDIIHGQWKLHRKGADLTPGILAIRSFPKYKTKEMKFTYEKAEEIATQISHVTVRLIGWRLKYIRFQ
jgi:hypothetical protein